jgi:transcriptional regulator with XRE-family HTH domain
MAEKRKSDAIDKSVGHPVRMRRIMRNMTQVELANKIGGTFQQLQKYEKGANRIGASRLYRIAQIMETPVEFFVEDLPGQKPGGAPLPDHFVDLMGTRLGHRLVDGLSRITDRKVLYDFGELIESIADQGRKPLRAPRLNRRKPSRAA